MRKINSFRGKKRLSIARMAKKTFACALVEKEIQYQKNVSLPLKLVIYL